jgi:hypothetical protein
VSNRELKKIESLYYETYQDKQDEPKRENDVYSRTVIDVSLGPISAINVRWHWNLPNLTLIVSCCTPGAKVSEAGAKLAMACPAPWLLREFFRPNIHHSRSTCGVFVAPAAAAKLIAVTRRRSLATNVPSCQRSRRKNFSGRRSTKPLSEWTDFNSANTSTVVVFAPGLSRGNRPGDTERDSGNSNQHLFSVHRSLLMLNGAALLQSPMECSNAHRRDKRVIHVTPGAKSLVRGLAMTGPTYPACGGVRSAGPCSQSEARANFRAPLSTGLPFACASVQRAIAPAPTYRHCSREPSRKGGSSLFRKPRCPAQLSLKWGLLVRVLFPP